MDAPVNFNRQGIVRLDQEGSSDSLNLTDVVEQLRGFIRRQFPIFAFIMACSFALGLVYLFTAAPKFTSHAMLLIDSSKVRILEQQQTPVSDIPIDTAQVETQVEILKSENIGLAVIKDLKLTAEPEFVGTGGGLVGWMMGFFGPSKSLSETQLAREALVTFENRRSVTRVGRTYVLDIGFTSVSPENAAKIANAVADAYIVDQLEAKYQATRRASTWLQDRIKELRQQASQADRAVLDYKEKNNIISIGSPGSGGGNGNTTGKLLGEQQLEELNTQLGTARGAAEEAKARLDRINEVMRKDIPDATVADSLHNEVINRLRNNYLDIAAKEAIWSARYGSGHLAAVNLRTQMVELRRSILDELGRIQQSYKSDYEIAKTRVEGLEHNLEGLVANSQVVNRDRLGLRDLESTAQVYHTIYDSFLQRYMEAIQQQSFPITESRVISAAAVPRKKSAPLSYLVLGIAGFAGLVLSFGAAVMREAVDRVFRTTRQVESTLQAHCIAVLPLLAPRTSPAGAKSLKSIVSPPVAFGQDKVKPLAGSGAPAIQADAGSAFLPQSARSVSHKKAFMNHIVDEPLSAFAEAVRGIKVAADISGKGNQVIGITSTLPAEGKSTVASNLAQLIAHGGSRIILLDGDLRNPSATRALAPDATAGVLEVLNGKMGLDDVLYVDDVTGLHFLPAVMKGRAIHTSEILGSSAFRNLVETLRKTYDYVIVDFPPLAPVVDVRATTQVVDLYLYVVEWGKTRTNLVQDRLLGCPEIHDRLLGVVLNKANVNVLDRYESYYGKSYYRKHYGDQYGYSE